jgi:hypothetical protein
MFNDPWSGFYQLGASFFTQAHFTQFTEPGWHWLDGDASGIRDKVTYGTLVPLDVSAFTIVLVNTATSSAAASNGNNRSSGAANGTHITFTLAGNLSKFCSSSLHVWRSIETEYFTEQASIRPASHGDVSAINKGTGCTFWTQSLWSLGAR